MPAELLLEAARMATAGVIVVVFALLAAWAGWRLSRRGGQLLLSPVRPWRVPWGGFEVIAAFLVIALVVPDLVLLGLDRSGFYQQVYGPEFPRFSREKTPDVEASAAVASAPGAIAAHGTLELAAVLRQLWAGTLALPIQLAILWLASRVLYAAWKPAIGSLPSGIVVAVAAWLIVAPLVLAINFLAGFLAMLFDATPQSHPLTKFVSREWFDPVLFLFQACVAAPLIEEFLVRGVILSWALGARKPQQGPHVPPETRVWFVALAAVLFAALGGRSAPIAFAVLLVAGQVVVMWVFRSKRRTCGAVWASAALFATMHSKVWPTPIPLFFLGLGLGWLAVRTRGVLVPAIVHGLFNAVSAVYVLRGVA